MPRNYHMRGRGGRPRKGVLQRAPDSCSFRRFFVVVVVVVFFFGFVAKNRSRLFIFLVWGVATTIEITTTIEMLL